MGALLVLGAVVMAVLFGRELMYELNGGGTPGTLAVERCDSHTEREHRSRGSDRVKYEYLCQGTFTGEDGRVAEGVQVVVPGEKAPGNKIATERVHGDTYEAASERDTSGFVSALGIAAVLLALGVFGLLTGFMQPRGNIRAMADGLPAPKVVGPVLLLLAAGGVVTVIVSSVL